MSHRILAQQLKAEDGRPVYRVSPDGPSTVLVQGHFGIIRVVLEEEQVRVYFDHGFGQVQRRGSNPVVIESETNGPIGGRFKHKMINEGTFNVQD